MRKFCIKDAKVLRQKCESFASKRLKFYVNNAKDLRQRCKNSALKMRKFHIKRYNNSVLKDA